MPRRVRGSALAALSCLVVAVGSGCSDNLTPPAPADPAPIYDCLPDLDGTLTADEVPVVFGDSEVLVDRDVAVSLGGDDWSFASPPADVATVRVRPVSAAWYASRFPGGEFAAPLEPTSGAPAAGDIEGIYSLDERALWLHGVASRELEPELESAWSYDQPVALLRFPLATGDSYTEVASASGVIDGAPYAALDTYEIAAVAEGGVELPDATFTPAWRVTTLITTEPAVSGQIVQSRQDSFYFECFGEIVRAVAPRGETRAAFPTADLLTRIDI